MKVFSFSLIALLSLTIAPVQNHSGKYSVAVRQAKTIAFDKKANEKGNILSEASWANRCKCADCILWTNTRIAIPRVPKTAYKDTDIKDGEVFIWYPKGSSYGPLLKELTLKRM